MVELQSPRRSTLLGEGYGGAAATRTDLPSCDGKVGEDAVLLILVAGVRLQTLTDRQTREIRVLGSDRQTDRKTDRQLVPFLCCSPRASMC